VTAQIFYGDKMNTDLKKEKERPDMTGREEYSSIY
jgi:hypothetical protein